MSWLFFDCMETLVDMDPLPLPDDYGLWALNGSGWENSWKNQAEFLEDYHAVRKALKAQFGSGREYDMRLRFEGLATRRGLDACSREWKAMVRDLSETYWTAYASRCIVKEETREMLENVSRHFPLLVVSNFMVPGGIEDLLERTGIRKYFRHVVTSVAVGYRKPRQEIFDTALALAGVDPAKVIFIGDDPECDFYGTRALGMKPVFYDPGCVHEEITPSVRRWADLPAVLEQMAPPCEI